ILNYYCSNVTVKFSKKSESISMDKLEKYRVQWWNQGNLHPMAEWDKIKLPYILVKDGTIDKYEEHADRFNVHGCWEWDAKLEKNGIVLGNVTIYELPSQSHEVCIGAIAKLMMKQCSPADETDAEIYSFGATTTRVSGSGKESDQPFRPRKSKVISPYGSDGKNKPWPNLVVEVAFSESIRHFKEKAWNYWLHNNHAHDVIVIKIDYVPNDQIPQRMKASTYVQQKLKPINKFEFGTHDENENSLNYLQGTCVIRIPLDCLYYNVKPPYSNSYKCFTRSYLT
ncbi:1896_t:CDS:2, partial [Entrophospora sp. SA101]